MSHGQRDIFLHHPHSLSSFLGMLSSWCMFLPPYPLPSFTRVNGHLFLDCPRRHGYFPAAQIRSAFLRQPAIPQATPGSVCRERMGDGRSLTLYTGEYSPGVVTASAIYAPLAVYIYATFMQSGILSQLDIVLSIIIGFAVMYVPTFIQVWRGKRNHFSHIN